MQFWCPGVCSADYSWRYKTHCYNISTTALIYNESLEYCLKSGGELASLETLEEFNYIRSKVKGKCNPWIKNDNTTNYKHGYKEKTIENLDDDDYNDENVDDNTVFCIWNLIQVEKMYG